MSRKNAFQKEAVGDLVLTTFDILPMLRKKLLRLDVIQTEHAIPLSHIQVLSMLGTEEVLSVSEISCRLGIAKPNITPMIDRLIQDGYVRRERNSLDRRVVNVVLLPQGKEKLNSIVESIVEHAMGWMGDELNIRDFRELERSIDTIERLVGGSS